MQIHGVLMGRKSFETINVQSISKPLNKEILKSFPQVLHSFFILLFWNVNEIFRMNLNSLADILNERKTFFFDVAMFTYEKGEMSRLEEQHTTYWVAAGFRLLAAESLSRSGWRSISSFHLVRPRPEINTSSTMEKNDHEMIERVAPISILLLERNVRE